MQLISILSLLTAGVLAASKRPNIMFILTDDQDLHMDSVAHMPFLLEDIVHAGTSFNRHFCTVALCCPSRATLWTGKQAHNHNITAVSPPFGGYGKIAQRGLNDDYLPLWMQDAGYNTYYTGKMWNFHNVDNYDDPYVRGYNSSDFLLDPHTYRYWDAVFTHNGEPPVSYAGKYSTDVVAKFAYSLLDEALGHDEPWFLTVAPIAPHSNAYFDETTNTSYLVAPMSAPRHDHLFHDYHIPRDASFNQPVQGGASWVKELPPLNESVLAYNDHYQRQRLRALQSVDEMVHHLVKQLSDAGVLEDTYIFYTTDNGYHISQHRMHPGKECGYDTDIHIPLFIRGPGIAAGDSIDIVTTHTDLAPTILKLAGVKKRLDGIPIPLTKEEEKHHYKTEHAGIEYWGVGIPEGHYGYRSDEKFEAGDQKYVYLNNTYRGLRLVGEDFSLYYSVWCTGERELFDLKADPFQTLNALHEPRAGDAIKIGGRDIEQILTRLDALLMVLRNCKNEACSDPWNVLHPAGDVRSLAEALEARYDRFYAAQPKMWFSSCEGGYFLDAESQEQVTPYTEGGRLRTQSFDYGNSWLLYV